MDGLMLAGTRVLFRFISCLPVRWVGGLGAGIGRICYLLDGRHREIALRNLQRIFPEKGLSWRQQLARESFAELGRVIFELPHVFLRSRKFLLSRVETEGEGPFRQAMEEGNGVFLAACHHSNWELGALMFSLLDYQSTVIYRPLRQAPLEEYLKQCRERFGARVRSRFEGLRWLPRALKGGASIGVMIDQHLSNGVPVPFMGHLASTTTLPATFACKHGTPIFGVALHRIGKDFRFRLQIWPVPTPKISANRDTDHYHLMEAIGQGFDPIIRARPELWLWIHRRWLILDERAGSQEATNGTA